MSPIGRRSRDGSKGCARWRSAVFLHGRASRRSSLPKPIKRLSQCPADESPTPPLFASICRCSGRSGSPACLDSHDVLRVLELPPRQMFWLRHACRHHAPVSSRQGNRLIVFAGGIHNAIRLDALRNGERLLQALDQSPFTRVGDGCARWDSSAAMVVPLENRFVILGGTFLVLGSKPNQRVEMRTIF